MAKSYAKALPFDATVKMKMTLPAGTAIQESAKMTQQGIAGLQASQQALVQGSEQAARGGTMLKSGLKIAGIGAAVGAVVMAGGALYGHYRGENPKSLSAYKQ